MPLTELCSSGAAGSLVMTLPEGYVRAIIPPHRMFRYIHQTFANEFRIRMGAQPGHILTWWRKLFQTPLGHQLRTYHQQLIGKRPEDLQYTIPLVVHNDAAPYTKRKSASFTVWGSVLGIGSEIESRFFQFFVARSA